MGVRLSTEQRDVYYKAMGVFMVADVKFSKGKLKQFLKMLSLHFPHTSPDCATDI